MSALRIDSLYAALSRLSRNYHPIANDLAIIKGQITAIQRKLLEISEKYGELMITPEGKEPEDIDKIGCQAYALLVITEGYKKRMLDWQDVIRKHFEMQVIERDMDPEYLLKENRKMMLEEIENIDWKDQKTKLQATRLAQLRTHDEYEAMSSFVSRKRDQDRT